MMTLRIALAFCVAVTAATFLPAAHAARSYDNCTGYVDVTPAVLTTQGTWCLRKDVATNLASGTAITIAGHNITLDCNDFKVGNLAAGTLNTAHGIASVHNNATVRNCNVRGYHHGVDITGYGTLVEDNRFDAAIEAGIRIEGDGTTIRRNRLLDTYATPTGGDAVAIDVIGDANIYDNEITNVVAVGSDTNLYFFSHAIRVTNQVYGLVTRNTTAGMTYEILPGGGGGNFNAIYVDNGQFTRVTGNHSPDGYYFCTSSSTRVRANAVLGMSTCTNDGNSL